MKDLIGLLASKPEERELCLGGQRHSTHLSAKLFKLMAKVSMNHVPYKGAGPAFVDLISGQVSMFFGSQPSSMPHVKAGKVRALAVTGARRSAITPICRRSPAGLPGFESIQWYGLLAPSKTPAAILDKLNSDFVRYLRRLRSKSAYSPRATKWSAIRAHSSARSSGPKSPSGRES